MVKLFLSITDRQPFTDESETAMSAQTATPNHIALEHILSDLGKALIRLDDHLARRRAIKREHAQLAAMSRRERRDIGLTRADVWKEINGPEEKFRPSFFI